MLAQRPFGLAQLVVGDFPAMLGLHGRGERDGVLLIAEHADEVIEDLGLRARPAYDDLLVAVVEDDLVTRLDTESIAHRLRQDDLSLWADLVSHTNEYNRQRAAATSA